MRRLVRTIAKACGLSTWYHVSYIYPNTAGWTAASGTYRVKPWLHAQNYKEMVDFIAAKHKLSNPPSITCITRLGV